LSSPEKVPEELRVVLPNAVILCKNVCTDAEIVMVLAAWPIPIPAPAEIEALEEVPFRVNPPAGGPII